MPVTIYRGNGVAAKMGLLARIKENLRETFSIDLKDDISIFYYNFVLTYGFFLASCYFVCKNMDLPTGVDGAVQSSEYTLSVLQTIADALIPTTITFACSVFIQNQAVVSRIGATKYHWNLILIFVSILYWGSYCASASRKIEAKSDSICLIVFSLFIILLCLSATVQAFMRQKEHESGASLSA